MEVRVVVLRIFLIVMFIKRFALFVFNNILCLELADIDLVLIGIFEIWKILRLHIFMRKLLKYFYYALGHSSISSDTKDHRSKVFMQASIDNILANLRQAILHRCIVFIHIRASNIYKWRLISFSKQELADTPQEVEAPRNTSKASKSDESFRLCLTALDDLFVVDESKIFIYRENGKMLT